MAEYLFAVQDKTGREVCSVRLDLDRVSDVKAQQEGNTVSILQRVSGDDKASLGGAVAGGTYAGDADELSLLRWSADNKLAEPVRHPVSAVAQ